MPTKAPHTPDLQNYRAIGSECLVLIPPEKRTTAEKLVPKGTMGRLLAVLGHQTYLVWVGHRRVLQTSFIKLYENATTHLQGPISPTNALPEITEEDSDQEAPEPDPPPNLLPTPQAPKPFPRPTLVEVQLPQASKAQREEFARVDDDFMDTSDLVSYLATTATEECYATAKSTAPRPEPKTFKQALQHPQKDHWLAAIFKEIQQLLSTGTFYFVSRSKARKPPITNR